MCKNYLRDGKIDEARRLAVELPANVRDEKITEFFKNLKPKPVICKKCGAEIDQFFDPYSLRYEPRRACLNCERVAILDDIKNNLSGIMEKQGAGKRFLSAKLSDFSRAYSKISEKSAFIFGPRGTGKTHLAAAITRDLILKIRPTEYEGTRGEGGYIKPGALDFPLMRSVSELLLEIRRTYNAQGGDDESKLIDHYSRHPVLILDDLGAEKPTEWARATLYLIINRRYEADAKTFITSNYDLGGIRDRIDSRISSRLAELCEILKLGGADRRSAKPPQKQLPLKKKPEFRHPDTGENLSDHLIIVQDDIKF